MKYTIKPGLLFLGACIFVLNLSAQTKYWDIRFQPSSKSKAVYVSTDQKEGKTKKRSYYQIKNNILARQDVLSKGGRPITMKSFYASGKEKEVIQFLGKGNSRVKTSLREDGSIKATYTYANTGIISQTLVYDKEGRIIFTDKGEGPPPTYPNGKTRERLSFKHNGPLTYFYPTGEKLIAFEYLEGVPQGRTASYYKNGQLRTSHKAQEIPINWWHENGQLAVKHENSTVFRYDTAGVLREEYGIKEYALEGQHKYYYPNGNLSVSGQNKDKKRVGIWQFFSSDGKLLKEIDFSVEKQEENAWGRSTLLLRKAVESAEPGMIYAGIPDFFDGRFHADQDVSPLNLTTIKQWGGYPQQARDEGIQGQVVFRVLVDETGQLVWYKTLNEVHPVLCHAIEQYLFDLIFEPAYREGKAIPVWQSFSVGFKLLN